MKVRGKMETPKERYYNVQYWQEAAQCYTSKKYTYVSKMELRVGDKVIVPTAKGEMKAIVCEKVILKPHFECKEIKKYDR